MAEPAPTKGKIKFKIISPTAPVVEQEVDKLLLPLTSGPHLILPRHAPLLAALQSGRVKTENAGQKEVYFISSGMVEVRRDICALCCWGIKATDVNPDEIRLRLEKLNSHFPHLAMAGKIKANLIQYLTNILDNFEK